MSLKNIELEFLKWTLDDCLNWYKKNKLKNIDPRKKKIEKLFC